MQARVIFLKIPSDLCEILLTICDIVQNVTGEKWFNSMKREEACSVNEQEYEYIKVKLTNRKHGLILTVHSWAIAKVPLLVLIQLQTKNYFSV